LNLKSSLPLSKTAKNAFELQFLTYFQNPAVQAFINIYQDYVFSNNTQHQIIACRFCHKLKLHSVQCHAKQEN